jgi:hypothetical protein
MDPRTPELDREQAELSRICRNDEGTRTPDRAFYHHANHSRGNAMTKTLTTLAAAATLAVAAIAAPAPAQARGGGGIAAGVIGGLAAGAIIGGAAARPYGYYGGGYYAGGPYYAAAPGCYWRRERVWTPYGWRFRRVRACY